jgi:putative phosphoribosyl transferase
MPGSTPLKIAEPWQGEVRIPAGTVQLDGTLEIPPHPQGLVIFAHGSGSSRDSPRNRRVARALQSAALATLLFDLMTKEEERDEAFTGHLRFDIAFLAGRLRHAGQWAARQDRTAALQTGYFGASTGAAAALVAAAEAQPEVAAIVSRGGRPDLAGETLRKVCAPTLLIVGGDDAPCIPLNKDALAQLRCEKHLEVVPGASHLFEEPGTLDNVARLAAQWFTRHLPAQGWHP